MDFYRTKSAIQAFCLALVILWSATPVGQTQPAKTFVDTSTNRVVLPEGLPDPIEPVNRAIWAFNKAAINGVVKPSGRVYRILVVQPFRSAIRNFGHNLLYPGRLLNNLLQGRWEGAGYETERVLCNSTVGLGGLLDVATAWKIPRSDANFGQTFGHWGWRPDFFLMLPVFGPSNDRDTLGLIADSAANPLSYFTPYKYINPAVTYNNLTDSVEDYARMSYAEADPYATIQYAWTFAADNQPPDLTLKGSQDKATLQTIQTVFFKYRDPEFLAARHTRSVTLPSTGKKLEFTYWMQPERAPMVYIVPGLGSHRLTGSSVAMAELLHDKGFSVVCVSSAYHAEFMEHASTAFLPGYTPVDGHDLHVALTAIDRQMAAWFPKRAGAKVLLGSSMGAFHSLFIAGSRPPAGENLLHFDRFVAINPPVRLLYSIAKLDDFFQAPLEWPAAERNQDLRNTFLKVAAAARSLPSADSVLPFNAIESKFLVGMTFRFILRDVIYSSQARHNAGVLREPLKKMRRRDLYDEILQYSYGDYFEKFVIPYYKTRGIDLTEYEARSKAGDLRTYSAGLEKNRDVRLITNRNDFLLGEEDLAWLRSVFAPEQVTIFDEGGHLGNLAQPAVQDAVLAAVKDLTPPVSGQKH